MDFCRKLCYDEHSQRIDFCPSCLERNVAPVEVEQMKRDIWVLLFGLGVLLFGWPFLTIFQDWLTYYLFIVWIVFIGLLFLTSTFSNREDGGN